MNKNLALLATVAALFLAMDVSAQTNITFDNGDEGNFQVVEFNADRPTPGPGTNIQLTSGGGVQVNSPRPTLPFAPGSVPPNPPRKTNREIIEFLKAGNTIPRPDGSDDGPGLQLGEDVDVVRGVAGDEVRVFNGEDREAGLALPDHVIQIQKGNPGRPVFFSASSSGGNRGPGGNGVGGAVRVIAASGTPAAFLRHISSSTEGFGNFDRPVTVSLRSSTSVDGNFFFTVAEKQPRIGQFLNQVFTLFRGFGSGQQ